MVSRLQCDLETEFVAEYKTKQKNCFIQMVNYICHTFFEDAHFGRL